MLKKLDSLIKKMTSVNKKSKIFKKILNVSDDFRIALATFIKSQRMISISAEAIQYHLDNYVEHTIELQALLKNKNDEEKRHLREQVIEYIRDRHYSIPKNFSDNLDVLFELSDRTLIERKRRKKRKINDF
jgi:hypothetical protein